MDVRLPAEAGTVRSDSGSGDSTLRLWDANTGEHRQTLEGHTNAVLSVAFSPDGDTIASGSGDNTIRLWEAYSGRHTTHTNALL